MNAKQLIKILKKAKKSLGVNSLEELEVKIAGEYTGCYEIDSTLIVDKHCQRYEDENDDANFNGVILYM